MPRGGGPVIIATGGVAHTGTSISELYWAPLNRGRPVLTNPTATEPLPCFRSGDVGDWAESDDAKLAASIDATSKCEGVYSMKLTAQANSSGEYVEVAVDNINYSDYDQFEFDLYASITTADMLRVSIRNNGGWSTLGDVEVAQANTKETIKLSLAGITHDDVEFLRVTSLTNTAFTAYIDRFVFSLSDAKTSAFKAISWTETSMPAGCSVQIDILDGITGAVLKSDVSNGGDLSDLPIATLCIKWKATLTSTADGSTPEIDDVSINWIPDRIGDWCGENEEVYASS
jgi:hypothetical protein